jgi:hypothetical protein
VGTLALAGSVLLVIFFGLICHSLMYALRTIAPTFGMASGSPAHRGLYWFEQVQRRDVREYVQALLLVTWSRGPRRAPEGNRPCSRLRRWAAGAPSCGPSKRPANHDRYPS